MKKLLALLCVFITFDAHASGRIFATSNVDLWVDGVIGSDSNICSAASPCLTPQGMVNYFKSNYDMGGFTATLHLKNPPAGGFTTAPGGTILGCTGANLGTVIFFVQGEPDSSGVYPVFNVPSYGYGVSVADYCWVGFSGITFKGPTSGGGAVFVNVNKLGGIDFGAQAGGAYPVDFQANAMPGGIDLFALGHGILIATGDFSISGNVQIPMAAQTAGLLAGGNVTVTLPNALTVVQFVQAANGGFINLSPGFLFAGYGATHTTGIRAEAVMNSTIAVNGNATAAPGNSGYVTVFGGQIQ